jgi:hypothetical protein
MKRFLPFLMALLVILPAGLAAQGWTFHGSAKNSIYSYESDKTHTRIYQYARFHLANSQNTILLNSSLRALTDANQSLDSDQRFKMYLFDLRINGLFRHRLNLALGRQFLHPGTILGGLDGLNGNLSIRKNLTLQFYGGVESQFLSSFDLYKPSQRLVTGGLLQLDKLAESTFQLLYLRKGGSNGAYWHLLGLNADSKIVSDTRFKLQAHYDLENDRLHRLLLSARRSWNSRLMTTLEFKSQYPQVYANSYFTIFEVRPYNRYRLGGTFEFSPGYFIDAQYQFLSFEGDDANQIFLSLQNGHGSLGMIYESGYAGDQLGMMFDYGREIIRNLSASVYVDYSKYRTETVYEYDDQIANAARLSYRFSRNFSVDVEYQWLTNKFKESDSRFLNHISYLW